MSAMRVAPLVTIIGALLAASVGTIGNAQAADDSRPCVSLREYRGLSAALARDVTKGELEAMWEVAPVRRDPAGTVGGVAAPALVYRACGFNIDEAQVTIVYEPRTSPRIKGARLQAVMGMRARGATATVHGHH